ncbi:hypothetical protein G0Q06_10605 [Puniceicoccales bacterium CK1056]|uniref:Uncharacterized protein n=1 Tax=Oceanipulchritudo coccoides TaxID=2706888 RepID=A0A6B2M3M1_9BACT|nr:hypothetical protein [Oceanipulchritudo coccoides]NDV62902.1 hypothetical protein [Oceanipulchritudo coccoides]
MSKEAFNLLCPARPSEVKILGHSLVDQLLTVERKVQGPEQFRAKQQIIAHFERHEPDLFGFFRTNAISPYQFLIKVQKAFETQSDVTFNNYLVSKKDAVAMLTRYIPNLQYLHDKQLYTTADTFKELGASVAIGVVVTGIAEAVGREWVARPFLSMETAVLITAGSAVVVFMAFAGSKNRNVFHKAPWNSAIYLGANLHETNPENWERVTWKHIQRPFDPFNGFTLFKSRPHYEALDVHYGKAPAGDRDYL